jgi:hypothetical protein
MKNALAFIALFAAFAAANVVVFRPIPGTCSFEEVNGDRPNIVVTHVRDCTAKTKAQWASMVGADTTAAPAAVDTTNHK